MTRQEEPITDETLMALADGELNDAEAADVRSRLARDPELALRFSLFAETGALAAGAPAAGSSPVPERLVAAILKADAEFKNVRGDASAQRRFAVIDGMKPAAADAPVRAPARIGTGGGRFSVRHALPLAASVALVVGAAAGWIAGRGGVGGDYPQAIASGIIGMPAAGVAIAGALERLPSGETAVWADPASGRRGTVAMVSSHRVDDGFCREYDVRVEGPQPASATGVSCRRNGAWRTELAVARAVVGGFAPASGGNAVAEQFLADIGSAGPLSAADERTLLGR